MTLNFKTIHRLFEEQVEKTPDNIAVVGEAQSAERRAQSETRRAPCAMRCALSYRELNEKAAHLASLLIEKGVKPDTIVGLMTDRSVEMVVGILGILKAGAAYMPIDPGYPKERIRYMLTDSGAEVLLTNVPEGRYFNCKLLIVNCHLLMSSPGVTLHHSSSMETPNHSDLAYIIYTSGSTGAPKGVAVTHGSVVNLLAALSDAYPLSPSDAYLLKTSFLFDVSVTELFGWFMRGSRLVILEKGGEKDPQTIIETIEAAGVTHINFVPAMFNAFTRHLDQQNINKISSLKYIFLAGEALVPELVNRFRRLNTTIQLENLYGPTEGTVYASRYSLSEWKGIGSIPIGRPLPNVDLHVVGNDGHEKPVGETGELCITGAGVAQGYLNNPELTAERFCLRRSGALFKKTAPEPRKNFLFEPHSSTHPLTHSPFYKTGDLACQLPDGNIEFLGRMDHQVKVRGFRVELEEIENRLLKHKTIKEAVVTAREDKNRDRYLCAYIVREGGFDKTSDTEGLREYISQTLPDYMIPSFFVTLAHLPLTGSGKVDRKSLPEPEIVSAARYTAPRDETEEKLADMWSEVLGVKKRDIGIDDNFFELGGHSLKGTTLISKIHKTFNVRLLMPHLFKMPVIRKLSAYIKEAEKDRYLPLEKTEIKDYYPLSSAQMRLYILYQVNPDSTAYNIPSLFELDRPPERKRLEEAFKKLISRHESLRTSLHIIDENPAQKIHDNVEFEIEYISMEHGAWSMEKTQTMKSFVRPFDLSRPPLIRAAVIEADGDRYWLAIDTHHIISDGLSIDILMMELPQVYDSKELPPLHIQYKDHSEWQNRRKRDEPFNFESQKGYWLKEFSGEMSLLSLPLDYTRPPVQSFEGNTIYIEVENSESRELLAFAKAENVTLYMLLLAAYNILLAKLSGQEDIVVGTPLAGRKHVELHHVVGMFVKTLALRNFPGGGKPFNEFLKEVKQRTLTAFENQDYPFEDLVEAVGAERDLSRNPLFDYAFSLENLEPGIGKADSLKMKPYRYKSDVSKFDITFTLEQLNDTLTFRLEYCTKLFKKDTVERFFGYYKRILSLIREQPGKKISGIEIISAEEKRKILEVFNHAQARYPVDKTIHGLFEEQAAKTPDHIAVVGKAQSNARHAPCSMLHALSYRGLNETSGQLVQRLIANGAVPGSIVGIIMEPALEMTAGIIAVMKAGCIYLPLNPADPPERKKYMLDECAVKVLLTQKEMDIEEKLESAYNVIPLDVETLYRNKYSGEKEYAALPGSFNDFAYVIFTSGSTGSPKGVPITHGNISPLLHWGYDQLGPGPEDRAVQNLAYYFDWSVWEIFITLTSGASLYLTGRDVLLDPKACIGFIKKNAITILHITPTQFQPMAQFAVDFSQKMETLHYLFIGAERLTYDLAVLSYQCVTHRCRIFNMYGPTEATIISATLEIDSSDNEMYQLLSSVPIGIPSANAHLMVLDKGLNMCPVQVGGELYIAGDGVAPGYLNNPELTAEKFCKNHLLTKSFWRSRNLFSKRFLAAGGKLYKTGDLVRWLPDGSVEFLDRVDYQVKIRGFRIETGEIENHLLNHDKLKEVVVIPVQGSGSQDKFLCAYFVAEEKLSVSDLREHLAKELPDYMIPAVFMQIEKIPINPNGKVDRKRLPEPERYRPHLDTGYVPPYTEMEKIISRAWKEVLQLDAVGIHDKFFELGGNSLRAVQVSNRLQDHVGSDIPVLDMFRFPTIHSLAQYLSGGEAGQVPVERRTAAEDAAGNNDIAVIGTAGRFPGAKTINEFWENLKNGVETISFFQDDELEEAGVPGEMLENADYIRAGGFLEDCQYFDAAFFNFTPAEADMMDPQLRLYHEYSWAALEDAGYDPETYQGRIGVYSGAGLDMSWVSANLNRVQTPSQRYDISILNSLSAFGTRISYSFGLRGPSFTVQTACSSSLVAVHLACRGLLNGECDIAMAGGVRITQGKKSGYLYQEGMILSPDGHNRTFDAEAKGTVPGDGIGVVVLKRLDRAAADRDHIYAVVKSSAINNDGTRKAGYTAPSIEGQAEVIREALEMANVEPESISYIETHGTGTPMGDPIEMAGLKLAFNTSKKQFCRIGSVKTNIGHLDSAGGIAGFIKTVLALNHGLIPPSLHFKTPNPEIDFENSPFIVNTELTEWKRGTYPLRAGVSSFGIGGTNAHVVLEAWSVEQGAGSEEEKDYHLLLLSAKTKSALEKMTANLVNHFIGPIKPINPVLANAAYTLQVGRKSFPLRKMLVCSTLDEAVDALSSPGSQKVGTSVLKEENSPVLYMFPGQGAQYLDMALGLYQTEPLFRQEMDRCFDLLKPVMGRDIKEILYPSHAGSEEINQTEIAQPVIFAVEYALARLLMSWGIKPYAMIGHSIGEYTAACLAGVFSLEDSLFLVAQRGKLMQQMPAGAMLSVPLSEEQLTPLLESNEELSLAAVNSSSNCVISGPQEAVDGFALQLKEKGHQSRALHTSHAFHSKMMEPILAAFEEKVKQVSRCHPQIPYLSNVTGRWTTGEEVIDPGYWASHLRNTVRFFDGLTELLKMEGKVVPVEVGPGRVLSTFIRQHPDKTPQHLPVTLVRHPKENIPDDKYLLNKIGTLWLYGASVDWRAFNAGAMRQRISLPTYPFERQPYPVAGDPFFTHEVKALPDKGPLVKKNDIAHWFYIPTWKEIHLPRFEKPSLPPRTPWLVFAREHGLCERLKEELEKQEQQVIVARLGKTFMKKNNKEFALDPAREGDYEALFNELRAMDLLPQRILHLWQVTPPQNNPLHWDNVEESLNEGFFSLLAVARSLGMLNINPQPQVQIDVVTSHMQEVTGEEMLSPAKAVLSGPVKVIPLEYPNIRCRSIDIVFPGGQEEKMINHVLAEVSHEAPSPSAEVAFRGRHRWVRVYEPVRLSKPPGTLSRLKQGGVYLMTGGLGGMGLELAYYLAKNVKAKLVLIEPFDFPTPNTWDQWLDIHPAADRTGEKIRKLRELEKAGAEVWVARADAANMEQMKTVVEETDKRFGPINGVIHTAGVPDGRLIHLRTRPFDEEIMAPKVKGTLVLDDVLNHQSLDFFFICSSLDAVLGDIGLVGYTAANCFLDAFASYKALTGPPASFTVSINWDAWQQVGMAADTMGTDENRLAHISLLRPTSHWVLGEHKVNGTPTLVGTAYLEMAATAFESLVGRNGDIEISDFYYLTPLTVAGRAGQEEEKEIRTIMEQEKDHWNFSIASRGNPFEDQWQVHARGKIAAAASGAARIHNIRHLREQCPEYPQGKGAQSKLVTVSARWDNIKETRFGENRGVARLELPKEFLEDMEFHKLHPALMDTATAFLIDHTDPQQAYLPFFFKRVRIKGALPTNAFSYVRLKEKGSSRKQTLAFDVTIIDDTGVELVDIEEMTVVAVSQVPGDKKAAVVSPNPADPLKNAILPHEGVEVFSRVLADHLHRAAVSTVDLSLRREKEKELKTPVPEPLNQPTHPRPELTTPYAAPGTKTQQILADIWQEYLGIQEIGIHDDFFELGADSLKALTVITRIHKKLNVEVTITDIFTTSTIAKLGEFIEGTKESIYTSIAPLEEKEYYPLSSAQMRLYLHQQMQAENLFYNLPFVYIVEGPLDMHRLERAYRVLIQRHESLRTSFELIDDEPVQRVHRAVDFRIKYHDAERIEQSEPFDMHHTSTIKHFVRPFDLACTPLMRAEVVQIEKEKYLWLFDIHHIITDATGYAVLQKDLVTLYDNEKEKLPPLKAQYKDFSDWQNRLIRGGKIKEQEKYWLNIYPDSGDIPRLNMPTDFPRPERLRFEGGRVYFKLGTEETLKLRELGSHAGATLFVNLLTLLNVLLFKYTGQNDIIVGSSVAGRPHADLQDIVGMFVNMLPIRNYPAQEMTYWELLNQVKTTSLKAFENQDMQFEMLVEKLKLETDTSRNPLFDIHLNVQNYEQPGLEIRGLELTSFPYETDTSKFDMVLWANPVADEIHFMLEYSTELFKPSTAEVFSNHFIDIIQQVIKEKNITLEEIQISHRLVTPDSNVPEIDFGF